VIEDNGVGISENNKGKLFTDYSRLEEHEDMNAKGTGLGLSICKNIIEQMGGNVEVES
jgi:signal transduction histidine kinase